MIMDFNDNDKTALCEICHESNRDDRGEIIWVDGLITHSDCLNFVFKNAMLSTLEKDGEPQT